ncbi:hypothetical protein [Ignatzschineria sp. LJL83]
MSNHQNENQNNPSSNSSQDQGQGTVVNNYIQAAPNGNTVGLIGFIFAIIAIFTSWIPFLGFICWIAGVVLSIIGLFKAPRGFAIAGTVISFIGVILLLFLMVGMFATLGMASM